MWEEISLIIMIEVVIDVIKERVEIMIYVDIKGVVKVLGIY